MAWRDSQEVGVPEAGRLIRGVRLPAAGPRFFTWDPLRHRRPDRAWRRWGSDDLVRTVLQVIDRYAARHPFAPRLGVGDLSRPGVGTSGRATFLIRTGSTSTSTTRGSTGENAPPDRRPDRPAPVPDACRPLRPGRASRIFVGPNTGLTGPPNVVQVLWNHDNHLHVRMLPSP